MVGRRNGDVTRRKKPMHSPPSFAGDSFQIRSLEVPRVRTYTMSTKKNPNAISLIEHKFINCMKNIYIFHEAKNYFRVALGNVMHFATSLNSLLRAPFGKGQIMS